jgi:hypothetical protein
MITHNAIISSAKRMEEASPLNQGEDVITTLASAPCSINGLLGIATSAG